MNKLTPEDLTLIEMMAIDHYTEAANIKNNLELDVISKRVGLPYHVVFDAYHRGENEKYCGTGLYELIAERRAAIESRRRSSASELAEKFEISAGQMRIHYRRFRDKHGLKTPGRQTYTDRMACPTP